MVKNSLNLCILLISCGDAMSKDATEFYWNSTESAPAYYPMEIVRGTFYYKGVDLHCSLTHLSIEFWPTANNCKAICGLSSGIFFKGIFGYKSGSNYGANQQLIAILWLIHFIALGFISFGNVVGTLLEQIVVVPKRKNRRGSQTLQAQRLQPQGMRLLPPTVQTAWRVS